MKAVGLYKYLPVTDKNCLMDVEIARPVATGRDLLVEVRAISVNPVDTKIRSPKPTIERNPKILGWDVAGVVVEAGKDVQLFKVGDEVFYAGSITRPGCNSEYHLVDERIVGKKPTTLNFEAAAAMPLTAITAWESLFEKLMIEPAKTTKNKRSSLLIIGGAGGVGSIAIQLAKQVAGIGNVVATAARPASVDWCKRMGADACISYKSGIIAGIKSRGLESFDYILCCNSTEKYFGEMAEIIKPNGKICTIVETKGGEPLDMNILQTKSVTFVWELMFTKSIFETEDMESQHMLLDKVAGYIDGGVIKTTLNKVLGPINADNLREAHRLLETGETIGKIVLSGFKPMAQTIE
jgi:NADPH2:quinone reductase